MCHTEGEVERYVCLPGVSGCVTWWCFDLVIRLLAWTCHLPSTWLDFRGQAPSSHCGGSCKGPSVSSPTVGTICPAQKQRAIEITEKMGDSQSLPDPPLHEEVIQGWSSAQNVALAVWGHCLCLSVCVWVRVCVCVTFVKPCVWMCFFYFLSYNLLFTRKMQDWQTHNKHTNARERNHSGSIM